MSLVAGIFVGCAAGEGGVSAEERTAAADFEATWSGFDGDELSDLRGRVVLLEFWRTW